MKDNARLIMEDISDRTLFHILRGDGTGYFAWRKRRTYTEREIANYCLTTKPDIQVIFYSERTEYKIKEIVDKRKDLNLKKKEHRKHRANPYKSNQTTIAIAP